MIPRWLVRCAVGLLAILLFAFTVRELPGLAVLVASVCGLAALAYLVVRSRGPMPPSGADYERDRRAGEREVPPPSS